MALPLERRITELESRTAREQGAVIVFTEFGESGDSVQSKIHEAIRGGRDVIVIPQKCQASLLRI